MQPTSKRSEKNEEVRWKASATIARLLAMGYSDAIVQQAIEYRGCEFDSALAWLLDHDMSEYDDDEYVLFPAVITSRTTNRDGVKLKIPAAVIHNERRLLLNSIDSDHHDHYHQKKEEQQQLISRTTTRPGRRNSTGAYTSQSNSRAAAVCNNNSHHESSPSSSILPPSPHNRHSNAVELVQDSNDECQRSVIVVRRLLCNLGYSNRIVDQALSHAGTDFDEALNWLLDHDYRSNCCTEEEEEDEDGHGGEGYQVIEEEANKTNINNNNNNRSSIESTTPSLSKIEMQLCSLGYSIEAVGRALNQVGSEFDAALCWLLDHCGVSENQENSDVMVIIDASESQCNDAPPRAAAYSSSFECLSSSTPHNQRSLQVDALSLHSMQKQPSAALVVTTTTPPPQHLNEHFNSNGNNLSSVDSRHKQRQHHTSKECNTVVKKLIDCDEKMKEEKEENKNHHQRNNIHRGVSGGLLPSNSRNGYVIGSSSCMQQPRNGIFVEPDNGRSTTTRDNSEMLREEEIVRLGGGYLEDENCLKSEDSSLLQPIGGGVIVLLFILLVSNDDYYSLPYAAIVCIICTTTTT